MSVCADGETYANGKKKNAKKRKPSPEQLTKVDHLLAHQSTALEASSMNKAEFCANDEAGKRARKQFREALKSSGSKECRDSACLWAIADTYCEMSQTKTTQPAAGALVVANPGKRNHEQSEHAEHRPNKKAKKGTQKAAVTAIKAAGGEAVTTTKAAGSLNGKHSGHHKFQEPSARPKLTTRLLPYLMMQATPSPSDRRSDTDAELSDDDDDVLLIGEV
jgi:hypothetical protein